MSVAQFWGYMYEDLSIARVKPDNSDSCGRCDILTDSTRVAKTEIRLCFICGYCRANFLCKSAFSCHLQQKHSSVKCKSCCNYAKNLNFKQTQLHIKNHQPSECPKCLFCFVDESNFVLHMSRCHGDKYLRELNARRTVAFSWVEHALKIISLKICASCGKGQPEKSLLHCEVCFASVNSHGDKLFHMGQKHCQCLECNAWFPNGTVCSAHQKWSTAGCCEQDRDAIRSQSADGCQQIEVDQEICKCKNCFCWFGSSEALKLHIKEAHFPCLQCNAVLNSTFSLRQHIDLVHRISCELCGEKFEDNSFLWNHFLRFHNVPLPAQYSGLESAVAVPKLLHTQRDAKKGTSEEVTLMNKEIWTRIALIFEDVLEWPLQMKLGVGRRKIEEIVTSILRCLESRSPNGRKINVGSGADTMIVDLLCGVVNYDEFSWVSNCDLLELLGDMEVVVFKHVTIDELTSRLTLNNIISFYKDTTMRTTCFCCNVVFPTASLLRNHLECKDYYCPVCQKCFVDILAFVKHNDKKHEFFCSLCGEKFGCTIVLRKHMYIIHDIDYYNFIAYCKCVGIQLSTDVNETRSLRQTLSTGTTTTNQELVSILKPVVKDHRKLVETSSCSQTLSAGTTKTNQTIMKHVETRTTELPIASVKTRHRLEVPNVVVPLQPTVTQKVLEVNELQMGDLKCLLHSVYNCKVCNLTLKNELGLSAKKKHENHDGFVQFDDMFKNVPVTTATPSKLECKIVHLLRCLLDPTCQETIGLGHRPLEEVLNSLLDSLGVEAPRLNFSENKIEWCFRTLFCTIVKEFDSTWTHGCDVEELVDDMQITLNSRVISPCDVSARLVD